MFAKIFTLLSAVAATVLAESGDATYFVGTVAQGACADKNPTIPGGCYGVAISTDIWDNTAHCGGTIQIKGPDGNSIKAVVVDRCMGCAPGDVDLYEDGFAALADPSEGRIEVTWEWTG